ncbi:TrkH family potassium uptake protein [Tissierella sp. MB52-C2]|uniref:TrkH family potassium uptake protein n=1 Tax=Tissierella sp. MB52-C2 TaxID=3070999 RepID=UPI00280BF441|nr:TrkH family potassium uptake protein [Tissierella sp. MB52-C2]WMM23649.1 TrkH family potassium uptake protein [Tissierella sp. MB52-C2]
MKKLKRFQLDPPKVLALGFASLILIGALLLNLPMATKTGESIGFINALFTSASAVCVTGLVVVNTGEFWSLFGQIVIIMLIQMGGLGFMTMATIGALLIGKKITLKERLVIKEQLNQETMSGLVRLTKYVILSTLAIEGIGAIFLSTRFIPIYGKVKGIWFSIFHAISAFCNAGFDLTGDSIAPFVGDFTINMTISALIILGGLGFSVYIDITKNRSFKKLSLHSKLVISITGVLLLVGMIVFFLIEYDNPLTLKPLNLGEKLIASFFQSVVPRTAGFYSVNLAGLYDTTVFLTIILMFIGASPGSTGGGIKTTTFGILILTTLGVIKGERDIVAFKKRIGYDVINRSLAIATVGMILIIAVSFVLTVTEPANFLDVLFETTSAFATVGSSRGLTPHLTDFGKIIITLTMYAGRVGPLTMAYVFSRRSKHGNFRYSEGNIIVG